MGASNAGRAADFPFIPFAEIRTLPGSPDLVEGVLPKSGLAVIWGAPKSGKSFWTLDLALHVALGWDYRSRGVEGGAVAYLALEGQRGFRRRVEGWRNHHSANLPADVPFYLQEGPIDLQADYRRLIASITNGLAVPPALVVIDTLNRSFSGSESSDEDMTAYVRAADAIRDAFGCLVVVVHHSGHDASRPRGHSALTGAADVQISIKSMGQRRIQSKVELAKDDAAGLSIWSRLEEVTIGENGEFGTCVIVPAEEDGRCELSPKTAEVLRELRRLSRDFPSYDVEILDGKKFYPTAAWRKAYVSTCPNSMKQPGFVKAFNRAQKPLRSNGLIEVRGQLMALRFFDPDVEDIVGQPSVRPGGV